MADDLRAQIAALLNADGEFIGCPDATTDRIMAVFQPLVDDLAIADDVISRRNEEAGKAWAHVRSAQAELDQLRAELAEVMDIEHDNLVREMERAEQAEAERDRLAERPDQIAYRIRAELVCCHIYDDVNDGVSEEQVEANFKARRRDIERHSLCYWGEASAQIAEGRCPGYETTPKICRCPCEGCKETCGDHQEPTDEENVA